MRTNHNAAIALNPESFRVLPSQEEQFAALRAMIDKVERDAAGATPASDVTVPVTAPSSRKQRSTRPMSNSAMSFDELCKRAEALGADKGNGADAQIKFAMMVTEAAYLGSLDLDPNKHGPDKRDGVMLAERYVKGRTGATIFDTKSDASRKLISNLDKCIKLGSCPKWGSGQPLATVNDLMTFRQKEKKAGKKVDDAFNTLMRFATAQLKSEQLIVDDELNAFVYKKQPGARDACDVLESIRKTANQLIAGKVSNCADIDTSDEVKAIIRACTKRLTAIAKARSANPASDAATDNATNAEPAAQDAA